MTNPDDTDNKIHLYNAEGTELTSNDDGSPTINGVSCSDGFSYTPDKTGIYIIGAGAYSSATGNTTVVCYPAPEPINRYKNALGNNRLVQKYSNIYNSFAKLNWFTFYFCNI